MRVKTITGFSCFAVFSLAMHGNAVAEDFTDAIRAYLRQCVAMEKRNVGIVVGIVDEHGSRVVSCGKMGDATKGDVDGDTLFEIGSTTKTFTVLLLQDMIERGEMKLDDPVANYVPRSVRMPTYRGKEITLRHLATHTSGLPAIPDNLEPKRAENVYADYTVERLYAFLSNYKLTRAPGAMNVYSNLGMGLLGHVIALKAGASYESLVVERICRPLKMDSTRIVLTPQLRARFATGHNKFGEAVPSWDLPTLAGAGALRSTANDLLKYVSANLGLTSSRLTSLMERTHEGGLGWQVTPDLQGREIISHDGGTAGQTAFLSFDKTRHRGVVVLTNCKGVFFEGNIGRYLLACEWRSKHRPAETKVDREALGGYPGQYQHASDLGSRTLHPTLGSVSNAAIYVLAALCLGLLAVLVWLWRTCSFRKRLLLLGSTVLSCGLLTALAALRASPKIAPPSRFGIGIRREGDRFFAQTLGEWSPDGGGTMRSALLPPATAELLPDSQTRFFERLSGIPITFSVDGRGHVTGLTVQYLGTTFAFDKISDQPPNAPEPIEPRLVRKLDSKDLDSYVGHYEFAPHAMALPAGMELTIWREGDQLIAQAKGQDAVQGPFEIFPEAETCFFLKISGARLKFIKDDNGEVVGVVHHEPPLPDFKGKKRPGPAN